MILQLGSNKLSTHHSICKGLLKPVPAARGKLGRMLTSSPGASITPHSQACPAALGKSPTGPALCPWDTWYRAGLAVPTQGPCSSHSGAVRLCHGQCHCHDLYPACGCSRTLPGKVRGSSRSWQGPPTPPAGSAGDGHSGGCRRCPPTSPSPPPCGCAPHPGAPRRSGLGGAGCSSLSSAKQVWTPHRLIWEPS